MHTFVAPLTSNCMQWGLRLNKEEVCPVPKCRKTDGGMSMLLRLVNSICFLWAYPNGKHITRKSKEQHVPLYKCHKNTFAFFLLQCLWLFSFLGYNPKHFQGIFSQALLPSHSPCTFILAYFLKMNATDLLGFITKVADCFPVGMNMSDLAVRGGVCQQQPPSAARQAGTLGRTATHTLFVLPKAE